MRSPYMEYTSKLVPTIIGNWCLGARFRNNSDDLLSFVFDSQLLYRGCVLRGTLCPVEKTNSFCWLPA